MSGEGGLGHHSRILTRRSVGVPKGFLIFLILHLLQVRSSSGSELTDEIEGITKVEAEPGVDLPPPVQDE